MVSGLAAAASAKPFTGIGAGVSKPEHRPSHTHVSATRVDRATRDEVECTGCGSIGSRWAPIPSGAPRSRRK